MDLDQYQEKIGGISNYQVIIILAIGVGTFCQAFSAQYAIFISAVPDYRCAVPPVDDASNCNLTEKEIKNLTIPYNEAEATYSKCSRYAYNLTDCDGSCDFPCLTTSGDLDTMPCDNGYHYDETIYGKTTTSQWDLICDRRYLDTIAQTLFFLGFFIGSAIVGPLSDWFGRKVALLMMVGGLMTTSIGSSFVPTYELFAFVRVLVGTFTISTFIAIFTYGSEISTTKRRIETGSYIFVGSSIGHATYPGIAYLLKDWRYIQLAIGLLNVPLFVLCLFIPETPRWLLIKEKNTEAQKIVGRYATSRGTVLTDEEWAVIVETENEKRKVDKEKEVIRRKIKAWDLFRRPLMRLMCFIVVCAWFTVSMVFYGLSLNGGNLAGDPYVNIALNGVVEIVACFGMYFTRFIGRRPVLIISFIVAGVACITSMLCDLYANGSTALLTASTALAIIGKFFNSISFTVIYAVTAEIFPTDARTTGVSLGSMAARVGSMLSPLILEIQAFVPWFTQTLFGTLSIISGLLAFLFPETSDSNLFTSLDNAEDYYKKNITVLKWFKKREIAEESLAFADSTKVVFKREETQEELKTLAVQATSL